MNGKNIRFQCLKMEVWDSETEPKLRQKQTMHVYYKSKTNVDNRVRLLPLPYLILGDSKNERGFETEPKDNLNICTRQ